jgi:hypothetical protein
MKIKKILGCNNIEIKKESKVIWCDPQTNTKEIFEVYENPTEELVKLWNKYSECEALPKECIVINTF